MYRICVVVALLLTDRGTEDLPKARDKIMTHHFKKLLGRQSRQALGKDGRKTAILETGGSSF